MAVNRDRNLGGVFNEIPDLYDRMRPGYPSELLADLIDITGLRPGASILEVGCGTGQATRPLAEQGYRITAVEPGVGLAEVARRRLASFASVEVESSSFETWDPGDRRFDLLVAASSWHWVDQSVGWRRAHGALTPGSWMAILGNVVVRQPGEIEMFAETADLHRRFAPDSPDWGHPPTEDEVRASRSWWGPNIDDQEALFGPTIVYWYPTVQWLDGAGMGDLLRTMSPYRKLDEDVREPLLDAIAERIRTRLGDRIARHYLSVLRLGRRRDNPER